MLDRNEAGKAYYITTADTFQVKAGPGVLKRIIVNKPVSAGTISIIDNTSGSTVTHGIITSTADLKPYFIDFDVQFSLGLRVITVQTQDITIVYA
jgi:hypothetical protein